MQDLSKTFQDREIDKRKTWKVTDDMAWSCIDHVHVVWVPYQVKMKIAKTKKFVQILLEKVQCFSLITLLWEIQENRTRLSDFKSSRLALCQLHVFSINCLTAVGGKINSNVQCVHINFVSLRYNKMPVFEWRIGTKLRKIHVLASRAESHLTVNSTNLDSLIG